MRFCCYIIILITLISCRSEKKAYTILTFNNDTSNKLKIKFFANEERNSALYNYTDVFKSGIEGDTLFLNDGDGIQLLVLDGHQLPTDVISDVIDSINFIQIGIDSVFVENEFVGFNVDSLKISKKNESNVKLNIFNDVETWNEIVKKDRWYANLNSYDEVIHIYTFYMPDLLKIKQ